LSQNPPPIPPYTPPQQRDYAAPPVVQRSGVPGWAVVLIALGCLGVGFIAGIGVAVVMYLAIDGPTDVQVTAYVPEQVRLGQEFTIDIDVTNDADHTQDVHCIDFMDGYLDGFEFVASDPPHGRRESVFGYTSYYYNDADIEPGQTRRIRITLRANQVGLHSGDIDTCINNDFNFITHYAETQVIAE